MNGIDARVKAWLVWALPFVLLAALVAWETDWGHGLKRVPALDAGATTQPVTIALLPEYAIGGGIESRRETIERTLFNPTRRPAPPQTATAATPKLQTGQFVLTGTTVIDQKATALLREVNGGRSRRVQQGETINGMLVAEVRSDRVKLTVGPDAETLTLKVAVGPKTTIQPQVAVAPPPAAPPPAAPPQQLTQPPPGSPGGPPLPNTAAAPQQPGGARDVGEVLANRRRAARAAEATAAQAAGDQSAPPAPVPQAAPAQPAQEWSSVYQRYIQRPQK
jgi:hypothetical protein